MSHQAAAQAELDAVAAVNIARMALTDAAQAVLQARLARIQAGEDQSDSAAVDGHVPLPGRNAVSRHGPALAHGLTGEIKYVLTRKPRNTVRSLGIALGMGLLYLGYLRVFKWDQNQQWLPYLGLRPGALLHPALARVGNVLSVWLPTRDEPIRKRRQSGSLKQFVFAVAASYAIGYLVNFMLVWRVLAAHALTERLVEAVIPGVLIVLSCITMWILLTVFAVALAQQPKVRRTLQKEIADYRANAEAEAFAAEQAAAAAAVTATETETEPAA